MNLTISVDDPVVVEAIAASKRRDGIPLTAEQGVILQAYYTAKVELEDQAEEEERVADLQRIHDLVEARIMAIIDSGKPRDTELEDANSDLSIIISHYKTLKNLNKYRLQKKGNL